MRVEALERIAGEQPHEPEVGGPTGHRTRNTKPRPPRQPLGPQMRSLLMIELDADPKKLISVLNYDGMPITADNIINQLKINLQPASKNITSKI